MHVSVYLCVYIPMCIYVYLHMPMHTQTATLESMFRLIAVAMVYHWLAVVTDSAFLRQGIEKCADVPVYCPSRWQF